MAVACRTTFCDGTVAISNVSIMSLFCRSISMSRGVAWLFYLKTRIHCAVDRNRTLADAGSRFILYFFDILRCMCRSKIELPSLDHSC